VGQILPLVTLLKLISDTRHNFPYMYHPE
jgi:hypothetical protein